MAGDLEIRTTRLVLRPLQMSDAEDLHTLWTDELVRHFLWDGEVIPIERTREVIETSSKLFDERGFGLWAIGRHGCYDLLGFAGYLFFRSPPELELVFGVSSNHWGQGFATEAARAAIQHGFEALGFDDIAASTDSPNIASQRVLEKLGMRLQRRAVVDGLDTYFYSLRMEDWKPAS